VFYFYHRTRRHHSCLNVECVLCDTSWCLTILFPSVQDPLEDVLNVDLCTQEGLARLSPQNDFLVPKTFKRQSGETFCAFATLATMINSRTCLLPEYKVLTDEEVVSVCVAVGAMSRAKVEREGITLDEFEPMTAAVLASMPTKDTPKIEIVRAGTGEVGCKQMLIKAVYAPHQRAGVNYHMSTAGQPPPYGHFSPLSDYHGPSDSFLVMDVWYETEPFWIPWRRLWMAASHIDTDTCKSRGFVVLSWEETLQDSTIASDVTKAMRSMNVEQWRTHLFSPVPATAATSAGTPTSSSPPPRQWTANRSHPSS
jgi:hypothetical protein